MTDGQNPPSKPMIPDNATSVVTHVAAADGLTCRFCGADVLNRAFYDNAASDPSFQGHLRRHDGQLIRVICTDDPPALACHGLGFWSGRLEDLPMDACTRESRAIPDATPPGD